jgi:hypothetical protein
MRKFTAIARNNAALLQDIASFAAAMSFIAAVALWAPTAASTIHHTPADTTVAQR